MMFGFWRYRARTRKQTRVMKIERILLRVLALNQGGIDGPISFARRHDMRFGTRNGDLLSTLFRVGRPFLIVPG